MSKILVRLVDHHHPVFETPIYRTTWGDITFTNEDVKAVDYVVLCNYISRDMEVECPPENVWVIMHEPPIPQHDWFRRAYPSCGRVFTPDTTLVGDKYIRSHAVMSWWVNKTYKQLHSCPPPVKDRPLSWITSNLTWLRGHQLRMDFLSAVRGQVPLDLWGRGFTPIDDKWDGLAPYKYSLAVENYCGPYYWTEKIADCFVSYAMPIYHGCTNLTDYFPRESYVSIDIARPQEAVEIVKETIASDLHLRHREAIVHSRELVLREHSLMPFLCREIEAHERAGHPGARRLHKLKRTKRDWSSSLWLSSLDLGRKIIPAGLRDSLWNKLGARLDRQIQG